MSTPTTTMTALRAADVSKSFGSTAALADVDFAVSGGEIHGLLGANGSGKSTLVKILAGVYQADSGAVATPTMRHDARTTTPGVARRMGVHTLHQNAPTFPDLSVAENFALLSDFPRQPWGIAWHELHHRVASVLTRFGVPVDPAARAGDLGPALATMVCVAALLQSEDDEGAGILILDEPTAALPEPEVAVLLDLLHRYVATGRGVVLVSHRLQEVMATCDRVTVLRAGRLVTTRATAEITHAELVELVTGESRAEQAPQLRTTEPRSGRAALRATGLVHERVQEIDLDVCQGEILGIGGLIGSGGSELLRLLFGDLRPAGGRVEVAGRTLRPGSVADAIGAGLAFVPPDRAADAAYSGWSLAQNLSVTALRRYWRRMWLRSRAERRDTIALLREYGVTPDDPDALMSTLSGGNQQKVILARWLRTRPKVLLLDDPTQGIDPGARAQIHRKVRACAEAGTAIVLASSDFDELAALSNRVLVMVDGEVLAEVEGEQVSSSRIAALAHAEGARS